MLRDHRRSLKLSTEAVAEIVGTTQSNISKWENGKTRPPDEWIPALAEFLGITRAEVVLARSAEYLADEDAHDDALAHVRAELAEMRAEMRAEVRELRREMAEELARRNPDTE